MAELDAIELPIADREVWRVSVSRYVPYLRIEFLGEGISGSATGPDYSLIIDGPLRLMSKGRVVEVDPSTGPDPIYLGFVEKRVRRAIAGQDGSLTVEFADGDVLSVAPDRYEPWQLEPLKGDGMMIVSVAGGGLATWDRMPGSNS
jgi:hypothetical protein